MSRIFLIIIGVLSVSLAGAGWALKRQISENGALEASLNQTIEINNNLVMEYEILASEKKRAEELAIKEQKNSEALKLSLSQAKRRINKLGEQNELVKNYLDIIAPDSLYNELRNDAGSRESKDSENVPTSNTVNNGT